MNFKKTCESLQRRLSGRRMNKWIGGNRDAYRDLVRCLGSDIEKLIAEEEVETSGQFKSEISSRLNELIRLLEIEPHTEFFDSFIRDFSLLVHNWNKELGNEDIEKKLQKLERLVENELTETEKISLFRKLLKKLKQYEEYQPESLELSRHYLRSLEEE